jgi:hypothetical protein
MEGTNIIQKSRNMSLTSDKKTRLPTKVSNKKKWDRKTKKKTIQKQLTTYSNSSYQK